MFRSLARAGLALAVAVASLNSAHAAQPQATNPALFGQWATAGFAGEVPDELASTSGTFKTHKDSDPLTAKQKSAARKQVPLGYVVTIANRDGELLSTTSFYGTRAGVMVVVRTARLATPTAVPGALAVASVVTAGYVRSAAGGWSSLAQVHAADGTLAGSRETPTTSDAIRADECSCGAAIIAIALFGSVCFATAAATGPGAVPMGAGCAAVVAAASAGADDYCETCKGTKSVTMNPGWAHGYQSNDRPDTYWTVCYSDKQLDGYRIAMQINAPMNFLTPPGAAQSHCRVFRGDFACCTNVDRVWDVYAWVEYPVGDWGYVTGKVTVYHYGA